MSQTVAYFVNRPIYHFVTMFLTSLYPLQHYEVLSHEKLRLENELKVLQKQYESNWERCATVMEGEWPSGASNNTHLYWIFATYIAVDF